MKEVVDRLNKLDWSAVNPLWQNILLNGDRVVSGRTAARFAARMIAYMCGEPLSKTEQEALLEQYASRFPDAAQSKTKLPPKLF